MSSNEYVLGTDNIELKRLKLQHDLWKDQLIRLWSRAGFQSPSHVLELGCGPGFTTLDLDNFLNRRSHITAVDLSKEFLSNLDQLKNINIETVQSSIEKLDLPKKDYDFAFCRWLLIFVSDIHKAIAKVHEHLKSGAIFAMQEYISYDSFSVSPESPLMKKVVDAIFQSWIDTGGYPNQGKRLPLVLENSGFEVLEIEPLARVCRPHEPLWQWPETFWYSFLPRLVQTKHITEQDQIDFMQMWQSLKTTKGAFCVAPTAVNIIAKKL